VAALLQTIGRRRFLALAALAFVPLAVPAQSTTGLTVLHTFTAPTGSGGTYGTNSDGANPLAGLVLAGQTVFGTTEYGGGSGYGTVFRVKTDGSAFTNLYSFTNGFDGATPEAGLVLLGNTLYGTAKSGGSASYGTVFSLSTDGLGFATLYTFTNGTDGAAPSAGLTFSGGVLYGTTAGTGTDYGTVFQISTNGSGFMALHQFSSLVSFTNADGENPSGPLVYSGGLLYGATDYGGAHDSGTIFAATAGETSFSSLYSFLALQGYPTSSNTSGAVPQGGVALSGNMLYGTAIYGGTNGYGVVFAGNTNGGAFAPIYTFTGGADGQAPEGPLTVSGQTLYGTTTAGTIFAVNTNGMGFTNVHAFVGAYNGSFYTNNDGLDPNGGLLLSGVILYGTAYNGGTAGFGTVFAATLLPPIPLNIQAAGGSVVLTWTNAAFSLQAGPAVAGVFTNVAGATSPFTNAITGSQMFFRLAGN
jgi:uncharacterized repeat protein (TIGR03803 family)